MFGLFGKKTGAAAIGKYAERAANKRAQAPDRWEAIQKLSELKSEEAAEALLKRFAFYVEPSITDQEEKNAAFEGILAAGDAALPSVVRVLKSGETIAWPIKILDRLVPPQRVVDELLQVLGAMHTDYERAPDKKIEILATLEERPSPGVAAQVARFLEDVNETVRFHAVGAIFAQSEGKAELRAELEELLTREESVRVRVRLLEGLSREGWALSNLEAARRVSLPPGFTIDAKGVVIRRS